MRDKILHEVDDDLYFSIDEKSHVLDMTDKGREVLSPNNPEAFIIPDLGELLNDIDNKTDLSKMDRAREVEKVHQLQTG